MVLHMVPLKQIQRTPVNASTVNTTSRLLHPNCLERDFLNPFLLKKLRLMHPVFTTFIRNCF